MQFCSFLQPCASFGSVISLIRIFKIVEFQNLSPYSVFMMNIKLLFFLLAVFEDQPAKAEENVVSKLASMALRQIQHWSRLDEKYSWHFRHSCRVSVNLITLPIYFWINRFRCVLLWIKISVFLLFKTLKTLKYEKTSILEMLKSTHNCWIIH